MKKVKLFSVNLYDYFSEVNNPKAMLVKEYCDDVKRLSEEFNSMLESLEDPNLVYGVDYEWIDITPELQDVVDNTVLGRLPKKYKFQLIADLVRYDYLYRNGGIYIDTDLELFDTSAIVYLSKLYYETEFYGRGWTAGEFNKGRIFACNWIMIDTAGSKMAKYLYDGLVNWATEHKDDVIDDSFDPFQVWGYALYRNMPQQYYDMINPRYFQGYSWNQSWKNPDLDCSMLLGAHHFGWGSDVENDNRPHLGVFKSLHCTNQVVVDATNESSIANK